MTAGATWTAARRLRKATFGRKMPSAGGFEAFCHQVHLTAPVARCLRLAYVDLREMPLHFLPELRKSLALKRLDHQIAAGFEPAHRELEGQLPEMDRARLVRRLHAGQIGGQVGNDKVDLAPAERRLEVRQRRV